MSTLTQLAELVATTLEAEAFSIPLTPQVSHFPRFDLLPENGLQVTVRPAEEISSLEGRVLFLKTFSIEIGFAQALADLTEETLTPLLALIDEVKIFCEGRPFTGIGRSLVGIAVVAADPAALREKVFLSVIRLQFRGI